MYPWRQLTEEQLQAEYHRLQSLPVLPTFTLGKIGYNLSNHHFQYIRLSTEAPNGVIPTVWLDQHPDVMARPYPKSQDAQSRWTFLTKCCAQFNPGLAVQIYRHYGATHVFDPYAGWGDRCVAAMACDIQYTGCDSNPRLQDPYQSMISHYPTKHLPVIHCPARSEDITIPSSVDLVFSSPPFYTLKGRLMEQYDQATTDYLSFMARSLIPLRARTLSRIALHLPQHMGEALITYWGPLERKIELGAYGDIFVWGALTF